MTASLPVPSPPQTQTGRPGPGLGISIGLMVAGALVVIASAIAIAVPLVNTFTSRTYAAPTHLSLHLRHARYTVFERTGSSSGFNFGNRTGRITIDPTQVTVTAPDGDPVFVFPAENRETMNREGDDYTSAVEFDAPTSGTYDVRLTTRVATSVIITRSIEETIRSVLVWFGTGAVGGILLVVGLVLLIVGVTRRGRARRAAQVGWGQPPWGQPGWGQPGWGQAQYPSAPYPPPPSYPPPQYPPAQYPPPPAQNPPPDAPSDPWAPPPR